MNFVRILLRDIKNFLLDIRTAIILLARLAGEQGIVGALKDFLEIFFFGLKDENGEIISEKPLREKEGLSNEEKEALETIRKLRSDELDNADSIVFLLNNWRRIWPDVPETYRHLEKKLSRNMDPETGHEVYVKLIERLKEEEIIEELDEELVYLQGEDILADYKRPTNLKELQDSVAIYLQSEEKVESIRFGRDNFLSPSDYKKFLGKVISKSSCNLTNYTLKTEYIEDAGEIKVTYYSDEQSYEEKFELGSEYFDKKSLKPLAKAHQKECSQNLYLRRPHLYIVEEDQFEAIKDKIGEFIKPVI